MFYLQVRERRGSDVSDIFLSPEAYKATQVMLMMMYKATQVNIIYKATQAIKYKYKYKYKATQVRLIVIKFKATQVKYISTSTRPHRSSSY